MNHPEIPKGYYCYTSITTDQQPSNTLLGRRCTPCPYWGMDSSKERQNNGFCTFLNTRDWDDTSGGLLWDQVKDCGINVDDDDEEVE